MVYLITLDHRLQDLDQFFLKNVADADQQRAPKDGKSLRRTYPQTDQQTSQKTDKNLAQSLHLNMLLIGY
jgi:hypothetical protein